MLDCWFQLCIEIENGLIGCTVVASTIFMLETLLFNLQLNTPVENESTLLNAFCMLLVNVCRNYENEINIKQDIRLGFDLYN